MIATDAPCLPHADPASPRPAPAARRAGGIALAIAALMLAACRERPAAAGAGPYADIVAQEVPAIEQAVGVPFKSPPRLERRTRAQVRQFLLRQLDDTAARRDMAGSATAYKLLGMVPDSLDLRRLFVDLLTEQVIGFYDPATKVLYVVDGAPKDELRLTITHELVHALQDQYVNLDSLQHLHGDDDRQMAVQAVIEGQATFEQMEAMLGPGNVAVALPGGWDRVRQMIRNNRDAMPVYARAPLVIQETLIFPYLSGAEFVRAFREHSPRAEPWDAFPTTTAQVLHPALYFAAPRAVPPRVQIATPAVARGAYGNDLGEFETRLYLYQQLGSQDDATRGAAGLRTDRYVVWGGHTAAADSASAGDASIAWATVWSTPAEAAEFYTLVQRAVGRDSSTAGRHTVVTTGIVSGRPVVLLVDTPARAGSAAPVTLADVRIGPG